MILFLSNAYPDFPKSFRGHFIKQLAVDLKTAGVPVVVVTPRVFYKSPSYQSEPEGIEIFRFPYPSGDRQLLSFKKIPYIRMLFFFLSGLRSTLRIVKSYQCKAIHAHWVVPTGFLGMIAGRMLNIPVIVHARGTDMHTYASKGPVLRSITDWTLKNANALIVTSHEIKKIMMDCFHIDSSQISVIPTGIDTDLFIPIQGETADRLPKPQKTIKNLIYVGGLFEAKGIGALLEALELLLVKKIDFKLTLVGEGPLHQNIIDWANKHNIVDRIILKGAVANHQIPELLCRADIFLLPSLNEGTPNSLLEAMACGLPSIASRVGEIPAIIEDGKDGLLIKPGSAKDLSAKIELLLKDRELYSRIAGNSRHKAMKYSKLKSLNKIIAIYKQTVGNR